MAAENSFNGWLFDDGLGSAGKFSRGTRISIYNLAQRNIISTPIVHGRGERRTNSRDVAKIIEFSGHVFGNPALTEAQRDANVDILLQNFMSGTGQLCVHADGRYWNAVMINFESNVNDADPWHIEYRTRFLAPDPWAFGANAVTATRFTSQAMTAVSGNLYSLSWTVGTAAQLGSAPSDYTVSGTIVTSNGCFELDLHNMSVSPIRHWPIIIGGTVANGSAFLFDTPNKVGSLAGTNSSMTYNPMQLDAQITAPTSFTLYARAQSGAPVITITDSFTARYR